MLSRQMIHGIHRRIALIPLWIITVLGIAQGGSLPLALHRAAVQPSFEEQCQDGRARQYTWEISGISATLMPGGIIAFQGGDGVSFRITFPGANADSEPAGEEELGRKTSYYLGPQTNWKIDSHFARVRYRQIYPGIDAVFLTNAGRLEYNFEVAAGADPGAIRMHYDVPQVRLYSRGDVEIQESGMKVVQSPPRVFQTIAGREHPVGCRYKLVSNQEVRMETGPYDRREPLLIDPTLSFSTYIGGAGYDAIYAMARDSAGNVYIAGETSSANIWNAASGIRSSRDAFVAKLNGSGSTILFTAYLGGSGNDAAKAIALDSSGNLYITGVTASANFPVTAGALKTVAPGPQTAFVAKLSSSGAVQYSTYLGGATADAANAIAVDSSGAVYVTGQTASPSFPVTSGALQPTFGGGATDCFISKLNASGNALVYSTFVGGSGVDLCSGIALDSSGDAYVTGTSYSTNFPLQRALFGSLGGTASAIVAETNATGTALIYSTFLGGTNVDQGNAIWVDASGNTYVAGTTASPDFPVTSGVLQGSLNGIYNAFVSKLAPGGASLIYSTLLGGSGSDVATSLVLDSTGQAVVGGYTSSSNFPTASPIQSSFKGYYDAFASILNPAGTSLVFSSYFGGGGDDHAYAVALAGAGDNFYLAGATASIDFPTQAAKQPALSVPYDGFLLETAIPIAQGASLGIGVAHAKNFVQGEQGATYSVSIWNAASPAGSSSGTVTVIETPPSGLTLVSMSGSGWSCAGTACSRSDSLAPGGAYPAITVTMNVASGASGSVVDSVSVSGGGSPGASAMDFTQILPMRSAATPTEPADFNQDGYPDVLWQNNSTRQVSVWYLGQTGGNTVLGTNWITSGGEPGWHVAGVGDFNGDGIPDILWENDTTFQVIAWYMGGTGGAVLQAMQWITAQGEPKWNIVAVADFNGDGVPDIVWENTTTYQVVVWYMGGFGGATQEGFNWIAQQGEPGWTVVGAGDFNGDGVPDIVWENNSTAQVIVWFMGGSGGASVQGLSWITSTGNPGWRVAGIADFNLDGVPDVLWENNATYQAQVWYMGGALGTTVEGMAWLSAMGNPGWSVLN